VDPAALAETVDAETEAIWEQEWRSHHVERAMRVIEVEFGEKDRQAFRLYAQEGRGAAETADALGLSVDQVYQAKSRILRRLGEVVSSQLQSELDEDGP
jgi:DNA-directed RNA polymerase specialized sigma24 family protein